MSVASQCPSCGASFRGHPPVCPDCGIELFESDPDEEEDDSPAASQKRAVAMRWISGQSCRVVEYDPATRQPLPGGAVLAATVAQIHLNGDITVVVHGGGLPGAIPEFLPSGWIAADGANEYRWCLIAGEE